MTELGQGVGRREGQAWLLPGGDLLQEWSRTPVYSGQPQHPAIRQRVRAARAVVQVGIERNP